MLSRPKDLWPDITNGNHIQARKQRRELLGQLRTRISEWIEILHGHPEHGPNRQEMNGILDDLTDFIEHLRNRV